jgi:hypothetical protein
VSLVDEAVIAERRDVLEQAHELLDDLFRHGCADVRLVFTEVPSWAYDEIEAQEIRRYPEGDLKREKLCEGFLVEYVPERGA